MLCLRAPHSTQGHKWSINVLVHDLSKIATSKTDESWNLVALGYLCLLGLGLPDAIRGSYLTDIIRELNLSDTQGSLLFVVPSLWATLAGVVTGHYASRVSAVTLARLGAVLLICGFGVMSFSGGVFDLVASGAIFGLGLGTTNVAQNLLVSAGASPEWRPRLLNGLHSIYALAAFGAPALVLFLNNIGFHWREAFPLATVFAGVTLLFSFFVSPGQAEAKQVRPIVSVWVLFKRCQLWCWCLGFYLWLELGLSTRLVYFCQRELGWGISESNSVLFGFFAAMFVGRLFFAVRPIVVSNYTVLQGGLLVGAVTSLMGLLVSPWFFLVTGLFIAPFFPIFIDEVAKRNRAHQEQAVAITIGVSAGAVVIAHFFLGIVGDLWGIKAALTVVPLAALLSSFLLRRAERMIS